MRDTLDRRTMLKTMAVGVASAALAGCSSSNGESGDESGGDESGGDESGGNSADFGGWFDDVSNFDGVADETGVDEVTVEVGAEGNGGGFAFAPAAVEVSSGATVIWEWTGDGGSHNVVADGGEFESEMSDEQGHAFSHTFDSSGTYKYYCEPHKTMGMKGAIVVE